MTSGTEDRRARAGLWWTSLVVLLAFGCTTVRVPASAIREEVPVREGRAEPQLELWIESGRTVSPEESARATAEARAALEAAVAGRQDPDGDALLVVRAQGVTRTPSRRSDQRAAVAGMVVGAVVVVAAVVVMVVASKGKGGGGGGGPARGAGRAASAGRGAAAARGAPGLAARGVAHGAAGAVRAGAARPNLPRPSPGQLPVRPAPRPVPARAPWLGPVPHDHLHGFVWIDFWYGFDLGPVCTEPAGAPYWAPVPPPDAGAPLPWDAFPADQPEAGEAEAGSPTELILAPPPELRVADRGFFAKDETVLELTWVDRQSSAPLRVKTVRAGVDPRDARKVRRLLDDALADERGWAPAGGAE